MTDLLPQVMCKAAIPWLFCRGSHWQTGCCLWGWMPGTWHTNHGPQMSGNTSSAFPSPKVWSYHHLKCATQEWKIPGYKLKIVNISGVTCNCAKCTSKFSLLFPSAEVCWEHCLRKNISSGKFLTSEVENSWVENSCSLGSTLQSPNLITASC